MSRERLRLPAQARDLWIASKARIDRVWTQEEWALGGGTLLAMRWENHRESSDIDILIDPASKVSLWEMDDTDRKTLYALDDALAEVGVELEEGNSTYNKRSYTRGSQRLDLFRDEAKPVEPKRVATIEDEEVGVLSTTQVLRGKLGRWRRSPVRDLYDFGYAQRVADAALRRAVQTMGLREIEYSARVFLAGHEEITRTAKERLQRTKAPDIARAPVLWGLTAVLGHCIVNAEGQRTGNEWTGQQRRADGGTEPLSAEAEIVRHAIARATRRGDTRLAVGEPETKQRVSALWRRAKELRDATA